MWIANTPDSLFGIIRRISKDSGIKSSSYPVRAQHDDSVFIGFDERVTEQDLPLGVKELVLAMGTHVVGGALAIVMHPNKIVEFFWKLTTKAPQRVRFCYMFAAYK